MRLMTRSIDWVRKDRFPDNTLLTGALDRVALFTVKPAHVKVEWTFIGLCPFAHREQCQLKVVKIAEHYIDVSWCHVKH